MAELEQKQQVPPVTPGYLKIINIFKRNSPKNPGYAMW